MGISLLPDLPALAPIRDQLHAIWGEQPTSLGLTLPAPGYGNAELPVMHALQEARTPEATSAAVELSERGETLLWDRHLDKALRGAPKRVAAGARDVLDRLRTSNDAMFDSVKSLVQAPRPYAVDDTLHLVVDRPSTYSHPSGHAARAFANATFLSWLDPGRSTKYMREAEDVALARTYAGAHFPTDIIAGARLGHMNALAMISRLSPEDAHLAALLSNIATGARAVA